MIPEDRLKKILTLLEEKNSISVNELKAQLYVSAATIRRDLAELSRRGMVVRSFGGAMSSSMNAGLVPVSAAGTPIGERAAQLVGDRDVIFLDSSAQTLAMTSFLAKRNGLTVVTDGMRAASVLCGHTEKLYCTGGRYQQSRESVSGLRAAEIAGSFCYDMCFFSCDGMDTEGRLYFSGLERLPVLQEIMRSTGKKVLLCCSEQIGRTASNILFDLGKVDIIVTDVPGKIPLEYKGIVLGAER